MLFASFKKIFFSLLFPPSCVSCNKGSEPLCAYCREHLFLSRSFTHALSPDNEVTLAAATEFDIPEIRNIVHALKYRNDLRAADVMACLIVRNLSSTLQQCRPEPWVLVPVPLHPKREAMRGFNQAEVMARSLLRELRRRSLPAPEIRNLLIRTRNTKSQTQCKNSGQRSRNVSRAFAVPGNVSVPPRVILLDDVLTTGATMKEASRTLMQNGASHILALTFAKA